MNTKPKFKYECYPTHQYLVLMGHNINILMGIAACYGI